MTSSREEVQRRDAVREGVGLEGAVRCRRPASSPRHRWPLEGAGEISGRSQMSARDRCRHRLFRRPRPDDEPLGVVETTAL